MALGKKLKVVFPEVVHVSSLNLKMPAKDLFIWQYAKERNFVIVSKDDDFEKLVIMRKAPPKLILLKTFNSSTDEIASLILKNRNSIESFFVSVDLDILEIYKE